MRNKQKENIIDFKLLSRVLKFVQPYKTVFFVSIFFSISLGLLSVARPIIIEYTVDVVEVYTHHDRLAVFRIYFPVLICICGKLDRPVGN
jgi:ATP-binding cassette subfamily B multidrug efflux pump